ncbi:NAD(P)-binding protein [Rhodobacteraceae bacterium XHP0102]|nr:NAD(P)-binding protein [Rhodobacteraceae bacterium XHP0102]
MPILVVGAGVSGATLARVFAEAGYAVTVCEARDEPGGHCATRIDPETGVMVHAHGPHIFHTGDMATWAFVQRFGTFLPYRHRVEARLKGARYALPVTLTTINQFFRRDFSSAEARRYIAAQCLSIEHPQNFEEAALAQIGPALYEAFFKPYTEKQWGRAARDLPASVFARLPVRYTQCADYFDHPVQAIPVAGYSALVAAMLRHPKIDLHLGCNVTAETVAGFDHIFWTGPIDAYFGYCHGHLAYRSLRFAHERITGWAQSVAVVNYPARDVPWTRITEHRHFAPHSAARGSVLTREYPFEAGPDDTPYYPVRLAHEKAQLGQYVAAALAQDRVSFAGRLGTYRYLDMDVAIREARSLAHASVKALRRHAPPPVFAPEVETCLSAQPVLHVGQIGRKAPQCA